MTDSNSSDNSQALASDGQYPANPSPGSGGIPQIQASSDNSSPTVQPMAVADSSGATPEAGDVDLIEKEWVEVVDNAVDQLQQKPYELQDKVSALRRDYLAKRYGKRINDQGA